MEGQPQPTPRWKRCANGVDHGEGEFAFGEIFGETFACGVDGGGEVEEVVEDLELEADGVDEDYA